MRYHASRSCEGPDLAGTPGVRFTDHGEWQNILQEPWKEATMVQIELRVLSIQNHRTRFIIPVAYQVEA